MRAAARQRTKMAVVGDFLEIREALITAKTQSTQR